MSNRNGTIGLPIENIFEVHLPVADRRISVEFYEKFLGFELAHESDERDYSFLWMGLPGERMLGLWGPKCPNPPVSKGKSHFAMGVPFEALREAIPRMRDAGVEPLDFDGNPANDLVVLAWMPAAAIYFADPDRHSLEFLSMLAAESRPALGVLSYSEWEKKK